uniref:Uncharacterized protein n=1 Tax=Sparus aurata TaxID=8175 RepID=A0A671XXL6_SPAAU
MFGKPCDLKPGCIYRMLWLSFLLIGSITCGPVRKGRLCYGSTNMAGGEAFSSGYSSYNSPEVGQYGVAYAASRYDVAAPAGGYGGGYGSSAGVYGGESSYGFAPAPQDEVWSSGSAGEEISEPVFSDVSDLEPVYSFSSRSKYQRGRAVFAQTRYTPEEPVPPPLPVSISKTASKQSNPKAKKYGYH